MANLLGAEIAKDDLDSKEKVIQTLKDFYEPLGLNKDITELGAREEDIDKLVEDTFSTMGFCVDVNARETDKAAVKVIYKDSIRTKV